MLSDLHLLTELHLYQLPRFSNFCLLGQNHTGRLYMNFVELTELAVEQIELFKQNLTCLCVFYWYFSLNSYNIYSNCVPTFTSKPKSSVPSCPTFLPSCLPPHNRQHSRTVSKAQPSLMFFVRYFLQTLIQYVVSTLVQQSWISDVKPAMVTSMDST